MGTAKPWRAGVFGLIGLSLFILTFDPPRARAADVCRPGENEVEYPTQQPLLFAIDAVSRKKEESREVRARLAGSEKPPARLRVYRTIEEKLESRLTATVVPIIQRNAATLELTASLHVPGLVLAKTSPEPELKALAARVGEALRAWRKTLSRDQKEQIQRIGTVELTVDLGPGPWAGVSAAGPLRVTFVALVKSPIDLYDIGKNLEQRLRQYKALDTRYRTLEGNRLEEGLARLDVFDEGLKLFDAELTASFVRVADLQKDLSLRKEALEGMEAELAALREENGKAQTAAAPALYVDVDNRRTSPNPAVGVPLLEDALRRAENADRSLYPMLRNQPDNKTTERLYRENLDKLDWLKATRKKHDEDFAEERAAKLSELSQKMTGLRERIALLRAEYRALNAERDGLSRRQREHYERLRAEFDTRNRAPRLKSSALERDDEEALLDAHDWVEGMKAFQESQRRKLDQELSGLIAELTSIDGQFAVLARDVMERRHQAGRWVIRALKKDDNPDLIGVLDEFNTLAGELKKASGTAAKRAERLAFAQKILTDSQVGLLGKFSKKIKALSAAASKVTSWAGPAKDLLELNRQLENNHPLFLVTVLEGAGTIASKVPVIGSMIKLFLDYNAKATRAILERAQLVHGQIIRTTLDLLTGQRPEVHLYSSCEVRNILEPRVGNVSDDEVQEAATELQIRRIMHLLKLGEASSGI